jgi:hypothetical protein
LLRMVIRRWTQPGAASVATKAATKATRSMPGTIGSGPDGRQPNAGLPSSPALTGIALTAP